MPGMDNFEKYFFTNVSRGGLIPTCVPTLLLWKSPIIQATFKARFKTGNVKNDTRHPSPA